MTRVELAQRVAQLGQEAEASGLTGAAATLGGLAGVVGKWPDANTEPPIAFVRCVIRAFVFAADYLDLDRTPRARIN